MEAAKDYLGDRDAIHMPYVCVKSEHFIGRANKVSLRDDNMCVPWFGRVDEPDWHGISDPFSEKTIVEPGVVFRVYIKKECFRGLRHDFVIETNDSGGTDTCHSVCNVT
jgi:hypothetical protein